MACYTLTTCGGVNPYYSFETTDAGGDLTLLVGHTVRVNSIIPDSGIGPNMPDQMCNITITNSRSTFSLINCSY